MTLPQGVRAEGISDRVDERGRDEADTGGPVVELPLDRLEDDVMGGDDPGELLRQGGLVPVEARQAG